MFQQMLLGHVDQSPDKGFAAACAQQQLLLLLGLLIKALFVCSVTDVAGCLRQGSALQQHSICAKKTTLSRACT